MGTGTAARREDRPSTSCSSVAARTGFAVLVLCHLIGGASCLGVGAVYGIGSKAWERQARRQDSFVLQAHKNQRASTHFFSGAILDHFGGSGSRQLWRQRFHVDSSFWGGCNSPVFLYIGGEATAGPPSDRLFMAELAKEHGAMMVVLEHRYYGESFPVQDMAVHNLQFLSSQQALADLMWFITWMKTSSPDLKESDPPLQLPGSVASSPWVAFGGSYPGNLATWLKLKYPHLLVGSVASSAPLNAEYDFEQYAQVVGTALADPYIGGSPECFARVEEAVEQLRYLVTATAPYGTHGAIPAALRPCKPMEDDMDLTAYEAELFGDFQGTVQYNEEQVGEPTVADLCQIMTTEGQQRSPVEALAEVVELFHNESGANCVCSSFQDDVIGPLANQSFSGSGCATAGGCSNMRQWIYQSCREFGFFQTTTGKEQPFAAFSSLTVQNAGAAICKGAYGITTPPRVQWSNAFYGGRSVEGINITLVNGSMDPWHSLGAINRTAAFYNSCTDHCTRQELSPKESIVFLEGTSHCRDMYASSPRDPKTVQWAHSKIRDSVSKWLHGSGGEALAAAGSSPMTSSSSGALLDGFSLGLRRFGGGQNA